MSLLYNKIYKDVLSLIEKHRTDNPRIILEERNVILMPFVGETKLLGMYKVIKRNRFVFYNPNLDERILRMVLAHELGHDIYHRELATENNLVEYRLLDITSGTEMEANIFASHLLLEDSEVDMLLKKGYNYEQMASALNVNANLMVIKLSEMQRMGYKLQFNEYADKQFFSKIDGKNQKNWDY